MFFNFPNCFILICYTKHIEFILSIAMIPEGVIIEEDDCVKKNDLINNNNK